MDGQVGLNPSQLGFNVTDSAPSTPIYHLLSGSFRSLSLFLLAFSPLHRTLSFVQRVSSLGPHQYLATNARKDVAYATSWAAPPELSSWFIERSVNNPWRIEFMNSVPITATSSYISCPPPYTHMYSAGGPTGEVHHVQSDGDELPGGFGEKVQEILFVPENELEEADKTRVALRYGSHAIEFSSRGHAFVPHLGTNSIRMYSVDRFTGYLTFLSDNPIKRSDNTSLNDGKVTREGPRHVVVSRDGNTLYSVTEHTSKVDIFKVKDTNLEWHSSKSILPPQPGPEGAQLDPNRFRGETVRLAPSSPSSPTPEYLFATTRGAKPSQKGFLSILPLHADSGLFDESKSIVHWETPTSGGKSNAIELKAKNSAEGEGYGVWIVLTDDEDDDESNSGAVWVLEWDSAKAKEIKAVAKWDGRGVKGIDEDGEGMAGGSHAIWLD